MVSFLFNKCIDRNEQVNTSQHLHYALMNIVGTSHVECDVDPDPFRGTRTRPLHSRGPRRDGGGRVVVVTHPAVVSMRREHHETPPQTTGFFDRPLGLLEVSRECSFEGIEGGKRWGDLFLFNLNADGPSRSRPGHRAESNSAGLPQPAIAT